MPGLVGSSKDQGAEGGAVNGAWEETEMQEVQPGKQAAGSPGPATAQRRSPAPAAGMPLSTSRDEFLHAEAIEYERKGGCFVSTGRATCFIIGALLLATLVGVLVYYLGVAQKSGPLEQAAMNSSMPGSEDVDNHGNEGGSGGPEPLPAPASQRLDPHVRPLLYQLHLKPYLGEGTNFSFIGHVSITLTLEEGANGSTIVFHSKLLNISADEVAITIENNTEHNVPRPTVMSQHANPEQETYALTVSPPLQPGYNYVLEIPFHGQLRDSLTGFYRTSYTENGHTKWMALTQFEATDARAAFPCFDEPELKAKFQISIAHTLNYTAVSNMPIIRTQQTEPGWIVDHFDITPKMSTYLVAFIISDMAFETANDSVLATTTPVPPTPTRVMTDSTSLPSNTGSSSPSSRGKSLSTGESSSTVDTKSTNSSTLASSTAKTGLLGQYTSDKNTRYNYTTNLSTHLNVSEVKENEAKSSSTVSDFVSNDPSHLRNHTNNHVVATASATNDSRNPTLPTAGYDLNTSTLSSMSGSSKILSSVTAVPSTNGTTSESTMVINSTGQASSLSKDTATIASSTPSPQDSTLGGLTGSTNTPNNSSSGSRPTSSKTESDTAGSSTVLSSSPASEKNSTTNSTLPSISPSLATNGAETVSSSDRVTSLPLSHEQMHTGSSSSALDSSANPAAISDLHTIPSSVATNREQVASTNDRNTALTPSSERTSKSQPDNGNRFATTVYIPSTSQTADRLGRRTTLPAGISSNSLRITDPQLEAIFSTSARRRKRQAVTPFLARENTSKESRKNTTATHLEVRMLVRPHLRNQARYALSITPRILNFYGDYFGIAYPLPKVDFAAIPDFQYGGMENWGLITYLETQVLIGPETTTDNLEGAATTVVHELGHQWFGNLVTPTWWTDIWLNEGFATYLEFLGTDIVEPTWEMSDKFVNEMHEVMSLDSLQSTHPVSNAVGTAAQIMQAFDDISYSKGACLIRMLNHSLTEAVFRRGLQIYIDKWKYSNAEQDDLWWSMEQAIKNASVHQHALPPNTTVKQVMDSWTLQPGFPVVTAFRNYVNGSVTMNQTRFTVDGRTVTNSSSQSWYVPVSFATEDDLKTNNISTQPRIWLGVEDGIGSITIQNVLPPGAPGATKWLLVNIQQTGYYRVNYDPTNWELLVRQLATVPQLLPASTRAQLISDSLSLARAGALPYGTALNLTRYLRDSRAEQSLVPWEAFLSGVAHLESSLSLTPTYLQLKSYLLSVIMPLLEHLKLDPQPTDTLPTKQLRARVLARALRLESRNVTEWATGIFAKWMASSGNYSIPVDLQPTVYCAAVMQGSEAEFNFVMARFLNTTDPASQRVLLSSLMCTRQPSLISMLLNAPLEGKIMRVQDAATVWRTVARNPVGRAIAFDFIREQWTNLTKRFYDTDFPIKDMLEGATLGLSTQVQLDDLKAFYESHKGQFSYTSAAIDRAIESLQEVISWKQHFESDIAEWLNSPAAAVPHESLNGRAGMVKSTTHASSTAKTSSQ